MASWTARTPDWVKPSARKVDDFHWLAYRIFVDQKKAKTGGMAVTMSWVRGGRVAPITERDETPITLQLAEAEMFAAVAVGDSDSAALPLDLICKDLGVAHWPIKVADQEWAYGVWRTLRWLMGVEDQDCPLRLPVRKPDGRTPTADELYQVGLETSPHRYRLPEERIELRRQVEADAKLYRELAWIIDDTKRQLVG